MSTAGLLVAAVVALAATSARREDEPPRGYGEIEVVEVGGDVAAVEVPVEVVVGAGVDPSDLGLELEIEDIDEGDGAGPLVEVVDGEGVRLGAWWAPDGGSTTMRVEEPCSRRCPDVLRIRVRAPGAVAPARFAGLVVLEGSMLVDNDADGDVDLEVAPPVPLDAAALDEVAPLRAPEVLEIESGSPVAGRWVAVAADDCGRGDPWVLVEPPPSDADVSSAMAQLRVVTTGRDHPVAALDGLGVAGACEEAAGGFWVLLAAPVRDEPISQRWALLGAPSAAVVAPEVSVTDSDAVDLDTTPERLQPVALPAGAAALHLAEGIDPALVDVSAGGPDGISVVAVDPPAPDPIPPRRSPLPWEGTGYAPVVVGPCGVDCPPEVVLELRDDRNGGAGVRTAAFARVTHLVVP